MIHQKYNCSCRLLAIGKTENMIANSISISISMRQSTRSFILSSIETIVNCLVLNDLIFIFQVQVACLSLTSCNTDWHVAYVMHMLLIKIDE